jgi:hypothetical protein
MDERKTARVACSIVNGVEIRLSSGLRPDGIPGSVVLRGPDAVSAGTDNPGTGAPVVTEVDDQWFALWLDQNEASPLVTSGAIRKLDE